jgi:O-acetyl-ADP-ribose deacetylase (regulator of RNase III)
MKSVKFGDILSLEEGIIVHGCNAHGIMGSGIALQIKNKYPECFRTYATFCAGMAHMDALGAVVPYAVPNKNLIIANAITQKDFGKDGKKYVSYKAISTAFTNAAEAASKSGLELHYPLIGAGLGGGDWAIISDIIDAAVAAYPTLNHALWIYE